MTRLRRNWWTAERFGVTPQKLAQRLRSAELPKIHCVSLPKSGTHLLERALCLHPGIYRRFLPTVHEQNIERLGGLPRLLRALRPGQVIVSHIPFREEYVALHRELDVKCLFMVRDPRDIAVSDAYYAVSNRRHYLHDVYCSLPSTKERMLFALNGTHSSGYVKLAERLRNYAGWAHSESQTVHFEELIGERGGGTRAEQLRTVRAIYDFLGIAISEENLRQLASRLFFTASPTFRCGLIRQWQEHFDDEVKAAFKELASDSLAAYGYENDDNW